MISRTPRAALIGAALVVTMAACASTDADDATAVTTGESDATTATAPTATEPDSDSTGDPEEPATSESSTGSETTQPSAPAPVAVPEALQFTAPLLGGGEFDGAAVADKPTLFWFWAPT